MFLNGGTLVIITQKLSMDSIPSHGLESGVDWTSCSHPNMSGNRKSKIESILNILTYTVSSYAVPQRRRQNSRAAIGSISPDFTFHGYIRNKIWTNITVRVLGFGWGNHLSLLFTKPGAILFFLFRVTIVPWRRKDNGSMCVLSPRELCRMHKR